MFLNLYFLIMATSQFIPELRIGYLYTYWGPLVSLPNAAPYFTFLHNITSSSSSPSGLGYSSYHHCCSSFASSPLSSLFTVLHYFIIVITFRIDLFFIYIHVHLVSFLTCRLIPKKRQNSWILFNVKWIRCKTPHNPINRLVLSCYTLFPFLTVNKDVKL